MFDKVILKLEIGWLDEFKISMATNPARGPVAGLL
jgi:hypothetical protein